MTSGRASGRARTLRNARRDDARSGLSAPSAPVGGQRRPARETRDAMIRTSRLIPRPLPRGEHEQSVAGRGLGGSWSGDWKSSLPPDRITRRLEAIDVPAPSIGSTLKRQPDACRSARGRRFAPRASVGWSRTRRGPTWKPSPRSRTMAGMRRRAASNWAAIPPATMQSTAVAIPCSMNTISNRRRNEVAALNAR